MFLHVGLGNPGNLYKNHRHNIGFMAIDKLLEFYNISEKKNKFNGIYAKINKGNGTSIFFKPLTFMNNSGQPVSEIINYFSVPKSSVFVWHDEIDLEIGKVRIKTSGGHGGHNGVRDITKHIGDKYNRIRIGIGRPPKFIDPADWVLSSFNDQELNSGWLTNLLKIMVKESYKIEDNDFTGFMNKIPLINNNQS